MGRVEKQFILCITSRIVSDLEPACCVRELRNHYDSHSQVSNLYLNKKYMFRGTCLLCNKLGKIWTETKKVILNGHCFIFGFFLLITITWRWCRSQNLILFSHISQLLLSMVYKSIWDFYHERLSSSIEKVNGNAHRLRVHQLTAAAAMDQSESGRICSLRCHSNRRS